MRKGIKYLWRNYLSVEGRIEKDNRKKEKADRKLRIKIHKKLKKKLNRVPNQKEFNEFYLKRIRFNFWLEVVGYLVAGGFAIHRLIKVFAEF